MFGLYGSGDGATVKNKPSANAIAHGTQNPENVHDIFYCTGHMEGENMNNYNFISDCMKDVTDNIYPRKELFNRINFDGDKAVHLAGEILEVDCQNIIYMLCTLNGANTRFSDNVNL